LAALRAVRSFCRWLFAAVLVWRVALVPGCCCQVRPAPSS
jgi:hypothetical protein